MTDSKLPECITCTYQSRLGIELDLYLPPPHDLSQSLRPALVYFHGGGLTVGEKTSWFPLWLHAMATGFAFISANYQLVPPATGHQILEDIKELFKFIEEGINNSIKIHGRDDRIDSERIAAIGTSAGGLCAYLAGVHAKPKPRAVLSMYGMGGDFLTPHYLMPKSTPFFRGRELLEPGTFSEFLAPHLDKLAPTSSSPLSYHGSNHPIPGYPSNPRMLLARLYLQLGNFLDYYTGEHTPSISVMLRNRLNSDDNKNTTTWTSLIPTNHHPIFPQLSLLAFPPTFFIHGSKDTAVPPQESHSLHRQLQTSGIVTTLRVCDGMEHSFDYQPDAEQRWGVVFDEAFQFLKDHLLSAKGTSTH